MWHILLQQARFGYLSLTKVVVQYWVSDTPVVEMDLTYRIHLINLLILDLIRLRMAINDDWLEPAESNL